ncbi:unnamed protein product [Schistosoma spindalis]|nr:unnamed protein product [Schistosoma spindale]
MFFDVANRLIFILLGTIWMIYQLYHKQTPQTTHSTTDHTRTDGIVSQTENVTHPMTTVIDVRRTENETRKTTLKILQSSDKQLPQTTHSTTDHTRTDGIVSQTENVTHPMTTVIDVHRIGNETRKTTLKILQSYNKTLPIFIRSPLNKVDSQGYIFQPKIVTSNNFSVDNDVHNITTKTKEQKYDMILEILLARTNAQRQQIVIRYNNISKTSLMNEMDHVKPNNLKLLLQDLLTDISILFAEELYKAIYTSNIQLTTSILMDFWENEFSQVENVYKLYSNESIWKSIEKQFGKSTQVFIKCVVETRKIKIKQQLMDDDVFKPIVNMSEVSKTFHILLKQMNSMGDNQQQSSNLLCKLNPFQIDELDMMYQRDFRSISSEVIQRGSSGEMRDLLMSLYTYSVKKPMYFATLIHDALYKELIDMLTAQRLLIFRSEIDLQTVCDLYEAEYGIYLSDDVKQKYFNKQDNAWTNLLKMQKSVVVY